MRIPWQYSLLYLLGEVALIAAALGAGRLALFPPADLAPPAPVCFCIALTAGCGALGGLCLRMAPGLVAGGVLAVSSIPLVCQLLAAH